MEISHNTLGQIHCTRFGIAEISARLASDDPCSLLLVLTQHTRRIVRRGITKSYLSDAEYIITVHPRTGSCY